MIIAGILIGACHAQAPVKRSSTPPSPVTVHRGKREIDGSRWVLFSIFAKNSFQNYVGLSVRPELRVQCDQQGVEHKVLVILESGPLTTTDYDQARFRVKFDENEPEIQFWDQRSDYKSYQYASGPNGSSGIDDASRQKDRRKFLEVVFAAKSMLVELHPFMSGSVAESRFDVSGLGREFVKYPECKLDTTETIAQWMPTTPGKPNSTLTTEPVNPGKGKEVFEQCSVCHNADSTEKKTGPGLKGLFSKDKLTSGKKPTEANVLAKINEGGNGMPAYAEMLSPDEKAELIAYLKTLK